MEIEPEESVGESAITSEKTSSEFFCGGPLRPPPLPIGYQIGLCAVALVMVILPLAYLSLIGLAAWGTWWYAAHSLNLFFPVIRGEREVVGVFVILYVAPIFAGLLIVLFMIKPLLSNWRFRPLSFPLSHIDHPELFQFIGQLCQLMGAPIPSRIDVDMGINAGAGFRAGFSSLFGNDIMLLVGLPLVAGMNCRELAAVIAHELGHFTQRTAMRCNYVIKAVNRWFARSVLERDRFDDELEEFTNTSAVALLIGLAARFGIACTRGILWLLMAVGHALSSFMSRQMEFHADACAIQVAGSEGFLAMKQKVAVLGACLEQTFMQFKNRVQPKYPDDFSSYIAMLAAQCSGQVQGQVLNAGARAQRHWYDSHPSDAERHSRAIAAKEPGVIFDERPAVALFGDFGGLSRATTKVYYQMLFRKELDPDRIFPVQMQSNEPPETSAEEALIREYFGGLGFLLMPVLLEPSGRLAVGISSVKMEQLRQARAQLQSEKIWPLRESLKQLDGELLAALQASARRMAGLEAAENFVAGESPTEDPAALEEALRTKKRQVEAELEPFRQAARLRLTSALGLLRTPAVVSRIAATDKLQDEVLDLLHCFGQLSRIFPALLELRDVYSRLQTSLALRTETSSELIDAAVSITLGQAGNLISQIDSSLGSTGCPVERTATRMTIVEWARAREYDPDPARMTCKEAQVRLQMLFALYYLLLGRLTAIASQVEQQLEPAV